MASAPTTPGGGLDRYVVIHVATTCDEHGVYVTKDSAEVIELGWILLDSKNCDEHVRNAGSFRDAINRFDQFAQEHLVKNNSEFAFVTLDSWDLRVQLPREARDKAVVLPPYLQHSRTFDLRTEYQRWQAHHPESLPFGSSALTNICAALEVEPVQSSAPIKHNLPFHLQALAPASPRRAMEEAVTLARVLRGLIRKPLESLCMNGRALNEKAIEVSPSSSRVLDRAADILTAFPPSKNRPRPGDWTCPSCGFSNFQRRTACFRCSFPAMSAAPDPMYGYGYGHPGMMGPPGHHMGHHHMGGGGGMRGGGSTHVPFRAGDWRCGAEGCNYHNFAKNVSCLRCGASRASAALVADSNFQQDGSQGFGMAPPSMAGTPGPAPYAPQQELRRSAYGHNAGMHSGGFDSRAEAAFSAGQNNSSFSNGGGIGLSGLSVSDDARRNGANPSKSPA
ncbi:unnamed protein product [Aureobasidium pullulans]|nr:unnamed protein product [Aureobasidium pullulans]